MMANAIYSYAYPSKFFFIQLQITFEKHQLFYDFRTFKIQCTGHMDFYDAY